MTDYVEEQKNEIEALESIYPDEYEAMGDGEFRIKIYPEESSEEQAYALALYIKYTPHYPDELPIFNVEVISGEIPENELTRIRVALKLTAEESLGMAMVFNLALQLKDELTSALDNIQRLSLEAEEEKRRKAEEAELLKFTGTRVTVERFMEWKHKFDNEMSEKARRENQGKPQKTKLTGRQLFENDRSLAMSDAKYMEEGDISVDISEFEREERSAYDDDEEEDNENAAWKHFEKEE